MRILDLAVMERSKSSPALANSRSTTKPSKMKSFLNNVISFFSKEPRGKRRSVDEAVVRLKTRNN